MNTDKLNEIRQRNSSRRIRHNNNPATAEMRQALADIDYLLSLLSPTGDKWLPIETAPKDGTDVLLSNGKGVWTDFWDSEIGLWMYCDQWERTNADFDAAPTHWQPLPAPPLPTSPTSPTGERISVQPDWCRALPLQQQSVLLLAARGPDGIPKTHPCKRLQRAYRACVLLAAYEGGQMEWGQGHGHNTFMGLDEFANDRTWTEGVVSGFFDTVDELPHHFLMHLVHGAQILGYKHPDPRFRQRWNAFYLQAVKDMHLQPESEAAMDIRLCDWNREHWPLPTAPTESEEK